jgi:glycosyltransferase involved in cell wall biosynthesis
VKKLVARLLGANRPKVIAVFGSTRADIECAVRHAQTADAELPVWAWCAEYAEPVAGCDRFTAGTAARHFRRDLREAWPALSIVAWTGRPSPNGLTACALKLMPVLVPPFRVILFNEAQGFFPARPSPIAAHLRRRLRDAASELIHDGFNWLLETFSHLLGADRPKVIAVFGSTRAEVECAVRHAQTAAADLPVWAWCTEEITDHHKTVAGCDRFVSGGDARHFRRDLRAAWPALSIVAWTGRPSGNALAAFALKLLPLFMPPFRVVLFNEAHGFFPARPGPVASHVRRRLRDTAGEWILDGFNWLWEAFFAVLAAAATFTAPLSRSAVKRLRSRQTFSVPFDEAIEDTFIEVAVPNRGWRRRAVLRAVTQSEAGFIVLRKRGETGNPAPLISLALKTNAFAVAKQSAHSAWRPCIVTRHPFRRLQPDEVSEVLAPFSSLIVLRRETLAHLGVPRALTFGGALLLLFWKASAAGLRSLAAGHPGPVSDEPAMALEDAELALRLSFSPSLAALGPARPARFRGNVARSPFLCRERRDKVRVLIVSPYLPYPLSHGGAVRIYNLCRAMAHDVDFVLACFREANETVRYDKLHEVFREVYIVDQDEKRDVSSAAQPVPRHAAEYRNAAMSDLIRNLCLGHKVDLVQLEYTQMAEYRDDTGAVPVLLVEHDITFTLYRQLAELNRDKGTRTEYQRWLDFEREALQCSNRVWTVSEQDRAIAIDHGAARTRTDVIPNGVDLDRFSLAPKHDGTPVILFVGSFRHLPNLLAFEALAESIMPAVWNDCPNAILHVIAGPHHEKAAELAGKARLLKRDPRIVVDGFVEDVRPAYRGADVVAIPLPVSAGTNIKVLEAMACGRAIVSTAAGCQGLGLESDRELIVADLGTSFSSALVRLLSDREGRARIARQARITAERRFGWNAIARDALKSYAALAGLAQDIQRRLQLAPGVIVARPAGDLDALPVEAFRFVDPS